MAIKEQSVMSNNRPKAIFYCGANGAGKSTLRQFNQDRVSIVIDSDHIAAEINPETPRLADIEAGKIALRLFRQALDNRISFSMESTLSGKSALNRIRAANEAGFYVVLNYIGLATPTLNIRRMQERVASGGHWIDPELIRKRYGASLYNLHIALPFADESFIFDNSSMYPQLQLWLDQERYLKNKHLAEWVGPIEHTILSNGFIFDSFLPDE